MLCQHPAAVMSLKNATCFVLLFVVLYSAVPAKAHLTLNNTCVHGTNYVQIVGFACLEAEERARNPNWDGNWATQGRCNLRAFELINANMNRLGIHINNLTYCANFTVRNKWSLRLFVFSHACRSFVPCATFLRPNRDATEGAQK